MKVASWNLNHWLRQAEADRWDALVAHLSSLDVDVALLQETGPPPLPGDRFVYHRLSGLPSGSDYGTAVVALNPEVTLAPIEQAPADSNVPSGSHGVSHPGTIAAATAELGELKVTLVSVYGRMLDAGNGVRYASTSVHRIISDLAPILDWSSRQPPVLVAGDFNCTTQWDTRARDRQMDATVFDRLLAHDMVDLLAGSVGERGRLEDCFCSDGDACRHIRTLRHRDKEDSRPFHIDYAFGTKNLAATATVIDDPAAWALSDHAPLLIECP